MKENDPAEQREWEEGWDGHKKAQLHRWAQLSFREKLLWLDEAQDQADKLKTVFESHQKPDPNR